MLSPFILDTIQFLNEGSLFFNIRYFQEVFAERLRLFRDPSSADTSVVHEVVNFYFMTICDGLASIMSSKSSAEHYQSLEKIAIYFMSNNDLFRKQFSFNINNA